jgi:PhzF family phenazine biosynthesis protein
MREYNYKKIDAFTSEDSLGNPAACFYLTAEQSLTEAEMLNIGKQHKGFVSEVVYCKSIGTSDFEMVYYSSEGEVPFCGHGTIACMYSLINNSPKLFNQNEIKIHTRKKGSLVIYNKIAEQDAVFISAPEPLYFEIPVSIQAIAENLQIDKSLILGEHRIDFIDAGNRTLIVPIKNLSDEVSISPDERKLKAFSLDNGIDVILIFCMDTKNRSNFAHTRVFAAKYGYLEDPATGSANSAFGYYLMKNNMWDGSPITLEQGGNDRVFNTVHLLHKDNRILFGGKATTRINGIYYV